METKHETTSEWLHELDPAGTGFFLHFVFPLFFLFNSFPFFFSFLSFLLFFSFLFLLLCFTFCAGFVRVDRFKELLRSICPDLVEQEILTICRRYDLDGDGQVSFFHFFNFSIFGFKKSACYWVLLKFGFGFGF
jgi:hypothetical protein